MTVLRWFISPLIAMALFVGAWAAVGSSAMLRPGAISYAVDDGGQIVAFWDRDTPWGPVWMDWATECQSADSGIERRVTGRSLYQESGRPVSYAVSPAVSACFRDGLPVLMRHEWQAHLFGIIPLRPVSTSYIVEVPPVPIVKEKT